MPETQGPGPTARHGDARSSAAPAEPSPPDAFRERLRDLTLAFSQSVSTTLGLEAPLRTLAADINALFGARRTSVWLHQRRVRELTLAASSDAARPAAAVRIPTDDADAPPSRGLRLEGPMVVSYGQALFLLAPLRGWRRALGTLVIEGPFTDLLDRLQLIALAHELGRQVSTAVENSQLLDEIVRQRRLLEDTFNSIVDLVVVTDGALRIVQMNDAFIARVGRSRAELLGRPLDTLIGAEMSAWVAVRDQGDPKTDGADTGRTHRFDDARLGGTFAVTMTPLINEGGAPGGHVLVARDITHQTRLESEREALRERLAQSEKLASLGQFVAGIAHEMNNPLQGVLGHLELMMETSDAAKPLRRELRRIYQEADRAAKIVRNLLAFTGSRRMKRRRLKMTALLSRVLASRASALKRAGIEVVRTESPDLPAIAGDPMLLHQAFLNLIINSEHAIVSAGHGGRIELHCSTDAARSSVTTTVTDSGPGIRAEVLPRIFDPFFTTKEVGQGTGLGLAITYGIVQDHDGSIHAANASGGGAVVTVALPAAAPR